MRHVRFVDPAGSTRSGRWAEHRIVAGGREYDPDDVTFLPPVRPSKVLGVGRNYTDADDPDPAPDRPELWYKGGEHVAAAHDSVVPIPDSGQVEFEAELGVVVGRESRDVSPAEAADAIEGLTCVNDISDQSAEGELTFFRRKSFDNAAPMGPVVADPEHVPDDPRIRCRVNGEQRQDTAGETMLLSPTAAVSHFSRHVTLAPGDVVIMGTPAGADTLHDGDEVEIEIEGVGTLRHSVTVR